MGSRNERSPEQQDSWEREISELHGRLLGFLRENGEGVHIEYGEEDKSVDSVCYSFTFQILKDGEIFKRDFSLSSQVYECVCLEGEEDYRVPDDVEVYLGFNEEVTLLVSPENAVIVGIDGSILRNAEELDFRYFENFLIAASDSPSRNIIRNPSNPIVFN